MPKDFDLSAYLVIGPENTQGRPLEEVVQAALDAGFTCIQVRSKTASARDLIGHTLALSDLIGSHPRAQEVTLLVNDRLDVALAARQAGAKVDGVHVGQDDIPVEVCRHYLGPEAIIGLSVSPEELAAEIKEGTPGVDYYGLGPLHPTPTKEEAGLGQDGQVHTVPLEDLARLKAQAPLPVVVGGGVKAGDLPGLARTGVDGFFVVSAVASADDPGQASQELVHIWTQEVKNS